MVTARQPTRATRRITVAAVFGTRPEAIKLAPVIRELRRLSKRFRVVVLATGQHRQMLDQVLRLFGIRPDHDLDVMRPGQSLGEVMVRMLSGIERVLAAERPDVVLVQGDASSAFAGALAAYYQRIPVGHVEAGLRTGDKYAPFPEEGNRRFISAVADWHFAPTREARANLRAESVPARRIFVTGNTVIDALQFVRQNRARCRLPVRLNPARRLILVTGHRRENFGPAFQSICRGIALIVERNPDVEVVYPVHLNPNVRGPVLGLLGGRERLHLLEPLEYLPFVRLMERSHFMLTDSGGIQEEAPALGKPVLVMRDRTERPEAVSAGTARLVGTGATRLVREAERLLRSPELYRRMARARNPFGDGTAAPRIVAILRRLFRD